MGLERYVPRLLMSRLPPDPTRRVEVIEGTFVFIDVSGFTKLSERLAKVGKEGAELLVDAINSCFTALLSDVDALGGSLVKFGGDALLLWFAGNAHAVRGCDAAVLMRRRLREVGRLTVGSSTVTLRMSVGVHSGDFHAFLVGELFHDLIIAGPGASTVVALEGAAEASQILISDATAAQIPARCIGKRTGPGFLLARASGMVGGVGLERTAGARSNSARDVPAATGPTTGGIEPRLSGAPHRDGLVRGVRALRRDARAGRRRRNR